MAHRLHVASTYHVEYGKAESFHNDQDAVEKLITENCKDVHIDGSYIEVPCEQYAKLVLDITLMDDNTFRRYFPNKEITKEYVRDELWVLYDKRDKDSDNIHLFWF